MVHPQAMEAGAIDDELVRTPKDEVLNISGGFRLGYPLICL
jgi:hypothetical protein